MTGLRTLQAFCTRDPERGYPSRLAIQREVERLLAVEESGPQIGEQSEKALALAEQYLVARGIEHRGTIGRTIVLPAIREALIALKGIK
jgi:hypothetical protein